MESKIVNEVSMDQVAVAFVNEVLTKQDFGRRFCEAHDECERLLNEREKIAEWLSDLSAHLAVNAQELAKNPPDPDTILSRHALAASSLAIAIRMGKMDEFFASKESDDEATS